MTTSLMKIKNLLVSACECANEGNRDISSSLMEVVIDEMEKIAPEDLEIGFAVEETILEDDDKIEFVAESDLEGDDAEDEAMSEEASYNSIRGLVSRMASR